MKKEYTIQELADKLSVSIRTADRYLKALYTKEKNKLIIPFDVVELLELRHKSDTSQTQVRQEDNSVVEVEMSMEDYGEFQRRLAEYPALKEKIDYLLKDIEYHRKSINSHNLQMELILRNMEQRNFIEAKDKKIE